MEEILPQDLALRLDSGCHLLDVRELAEYHLCALPGAVHIPLGEIPNRFGELAPDEEWVVYCHHGTRSSFAVEFLHAVGFTRLKNLSGGIDAWAAQVDPSMARY